MILFTICVFFLGPDDQKCSLRAYIGTGKIITFAFHFFYFKTFSGKVDKWFFHFSKAKVKKVKKSLFQKKSKSEKSEKQKWLFFAFQCMPTGSTGVCS